MIDKEFLKRKSIIDYKIEEKFYSKKNNVYKVKLTEKDEQERICVLKKYNQEKRMDREVDWMINLRKKGVRVPAIYYVGKNQFIMEYIYGTTFLEVIYQMENEKKENDQLVRNLCIWLKKFYAASKEITGKNIIFGDMHLRNFIVGNHIYGIDFEDCCEGQIEEDAGKLCAFILTYSPAFTHWKISFAKRVLEILIEELHLEDEFVKKEIEKALISIKKRRNL